MQEAYSATPAIPVSIRPETEPEQEPEPEVHATAGARSIRRSPANELGDLLNHLFFDAGIAVLGKGAAWIGGHRMTMLEREACFVG